MKRSEILFKLLKAIQEVRLNTPRQVFIEAGFSGVFGVTLGEWNKRFENKENYSRKVKEKTEKQQFYNKFYQLKRSGLIKRDSNLNWLLTIKGKKKLLYLKEKFLFFKNYQTQDSKQHIVIVFDIPEGLRQKRDWLRSALINLKFKMLQKSVWIGKVKLPKEFLEDLRRLRIWRYIHIFMVTKTGSLTYD